MSGAASPRRTLEAEEFQRCGRAILGSDWRRELVEILDLDAGLVDGWAEGLVPVPYLVVKILASLAQFRGEDLLRLSDRLRTDLQGWIEDA